MGKVGLGHQYWVGKCLRGLFTGLITGALISLYSQTISLLTRLNQSLPFLVFLIPLGAVLTQYLFKVFGERYRNSTTSAIDEINNHKNHRNWAESQIPDTISPIMGLLAYLGASITHLVGASGGKEGAGVQIGLASASVVEHVEAWGNRRLGREHDNRSDYYLMCGAGAAFAALFNAPIAGVFFGTQLASPRATRLDAYLPVTISSFTAVLLSQAIGIHVLEIPFYLELEFSARNLFYVSLFAILTGLYSRLFCFVLHRIRDFFRKRVSSPYLVVLWPSLVLLLLSLATWPIFDTFRYNGLGGDLLYDIIIGRASQLDDLIKLALVAFTFAAGFVGGEVVPLIVVGAGFGMSMSHLFNVPLSPFAVLGSLGMLSGGTNLPIVCFALGLELFGYREPCLLFIMVTLSFVASGHSGIYSHQRLPYR